MSRVDPRAGDESAPARYRLYGLSVECSEPIPALPVSGDEEEPDVRVTFGAHPLADAGGWRPVEVAVADRARTACLRTAFHRMACPGRDHLAVPLWVVDHHARPRPGCALPCHRPEHSPGSR